MVYDRGSQMGVRGPLGIPEVLINGDFFLHVYLLARNIIQKYEFLLISLVICF